MSEAEAPVKSGHSRRYARTPEPGGVLPDLSGLLGGALDDLMDHLGPYVILVLVRALIAMPLVAVCVVLLYVAIFVVYLGGMFGGLVLSIGAGAFVGSAAGEDAGALIVLLGTFLSFFATLALMAVAVVVCMAPLALLAPLTGGAWRAVARHQRGEAQLQGTEFLSMSGERWLHMILVQAAVLFSVALGMLFFVVGALVPLKLFAFAPGLVALHRMSWLQALRTSARHTVRHFRFHGPYSAVFIGLSMVAGYVPFLGAAYLLALQVRTYRALFGDGDEPVLQAR